MNLFNKKEEPEEEQKQEEENNDNNIENNNEENNNEERLDKSTEDIKEDIKEETSQSQSNPYLPFQPKYFLEDNPTVKEPFDIKNVSFKNLLTLGKKKEEEGKVKKIKFKVSSKTTFKPKENKNLLSSEVENRLLGNKEKENLTLESQKSNLLGD